MPKTVESGLQERALQLGPDGELIGILNSPGDPAVPARPVVLVLNAGVVHRVGPHRLHVVLARRLAGYGISSFRLDLSGIGDSRPVPGALSFRESAVTDLRLVMDQLKIETGATRFILFGLCSGADNALATAATDSRVVGLVLLDPPAYVTLPAWVRHASARLRELGSVSAVAAWGARTLASQGRNLLSKLTRQEIIDQITGERETPPPAFYRAQLNALVTRGVPILAGFSGSLRERYNAKGQLFELFPELRGRVDVAYFPNANHTFTELVVQAELTSTVTTWIRAQL